MWDILGIPPTTAPALIRRAYATQLRSLDVDRNPAAFIALRAAYEHALASCEVAEPVPPKRPRLQQSEETPPAPLGRDAREPPPEGLADDWLQAALAAGGVVGALEAYNRNMARGLVGLGQQRRRAADLAAAALSDAALPVATFRAVISALGLQRGDTRHDDLAPLRRDIAARLAACEWFEAVVHTAGKRAFGRRKHEVRAARLFLDAGRRLGRSRAALDSTERLLAGYRTHAKWLTAETDAGRIELLEGRLKRALTRKARRDKWFIFAVIGFFVIDGLYVLVKTLFFG